MAIQYVTGRQNTTFVPASKQDLINQIETILLAAGWTTVSGSGTTNLLMQSAATPQGYAIRVRLKDNAGVCVTFSLESTDGSLVGGNSTTAGGAFLNPGTSQTFRVVANKYQAFIWTTPSTVARAFAAFGVPYVPAFLTGATTRLAWMMGNSATDADTSTRLCFRTALQCTLGGTPIGGPSVECVFGSSIWAINITTSFNGNGTPALASFVSMYPVTSGSLGTLCYRWQDTSALLIDPLIAWGDTAANVEGRFKGQIWDAVLSTEAYVTDTTANFDSHNWIVLTDNNSGGANATRGTLLLAVP